MAPSPARKTDPVRTFAARRGRLSPLTRDRLETLGPARWLPPGPLEPVATFGRSAPVVLEVGCGHGAAAVAYAVSHPSHDVLAVDVHTPGVARMLAAADHLQVTNLRAELGDAVTLLADRISPGALAAVHLFFPDPWPKNKHAKRRFVSAHTLDLLASRLEAEGYVLVATDQRPYAAHVASVVERHGEFVLREVERPSWRPLDGFERRAVEVGRGIVDLRLDRRVQDVTRAGDENRTRVISLED